MTFEIDVNGRTRTVAVERAGTGRFRVTLDGAAHHIDADRVGAYGLSLIVDGDTRSSRDVTVTPAAGPGELLVGIDGRVVQAAVNSRQTGRGGAEATTQAQGDAVIAAPMPGRVVRILVSPGDEVAARQGVIVVEAMKMENELRAPKAGRVKDVAVAPGASVEAGRTLVVIE